MAWAGLWVALAAAVAAALATAGFLWLAIRRGLAAGGDDPDED
jgi:hypothetical protein